MSLGTKPSSGSRLVLVGPAHMDAAHCRANLAISLNVGAAADCRVAWERATGLEHHPYRDVVTRVDFLPDRRPSARGNGRLEAWLERVLTESTG